MKAFTTQVTNVIIRYISILHGFEKKQTNGFFLFSFYTFELFIHLNDRNFSIHYDAIRVLVEWTKKNHENS